MPWFGSMMFCNEFMMIMQFLHLVNNTIALPKDNLNYDKLFKFGGIHITLNKLFGDIYEPTGSLSIDEEMIRIKSRTSFLQYIPKKPNKFGIKVSALCQSWETFTGKAEGGNVEHDLSYRVVMNLMRLKLDKSYHLYMDNFYTNLSLFRALLDRQTYACGTITVNRGEFPQWLKTEKLNAGDETYIWNDDIFLAVHWKGKRNVFVLSSFRGNFAKVIERYSGNVVKPDCFSEYSQHMGGVDKCDQLLSNYAISKKSIKWWKKGFFLITWITCDKFNVLVFREESRV